MKKTIKSSYEDAFTVYPWSNECWKYSDHDLGLSYVVESYGEEFLNLDENTLENEKENLIRYFDDDAFVRDFNIMNPDEQIESIHDIEEPEDLSLEKLARYFDYESFGRDIRLEYNMVWDNKRNCWFSAQDIDEFENEDDITFLGNSHRNPLKSSSIRYYIRYKDGTTKDIPRDELPKDGIDEYKYNDEVIRIEDSTGKVIKSSKKITSANNYGWEVDSSDAHKALNMWIEQVGEDSALEDIAKALSTDDLDENIDWVAQQWGFGEELDEIEDAWDKYEYAKDIMGTEELLTNLTQAIGYDELAECMAFIFRMNDFREWDSVTSSRKPVKSSYLYTVEINMKDGNVYQEDYEAESDKWSEAKKEIRADVESDFPEMKNFTMIEKNVITSHKLVKSARFIVEDESGVVIGEADTYEEAKTLNGIIIDTQKDSIQSRRKPVKSSRIQEKPIDYFEAKNVWKSLGLQSYGASSCTVLYDDLKDDSNEINHEVHYNTTMTGYELEDPDTKVQWAGNTYEELKADLLDWMNQYGIEAVTSSRKPVKSSFDDDETIDVETIKEEWENEGYNPDVIERFFDEEEIEDEITYSQEHELHKKFEKYNLNITSSKKISNGNFPREITKAVLSNRMTQEEAITQICSRNNCNRGFAKNILSRWINEKYETLLKSDAEIADIQKEFDVDGDLESWAEDYMPGSGKANTKGGELVRAAMRIIAEYQNNVNMIGRGYGNESVNPAARYIVEKTSFSGNGEIEDMLDHVVQMTDSEYQSWLKRFQSDFENYLRDNSGLFSEPNDDDIADYIEDTDFEFFLREFYAEDSEGNQYHFKLDSDDPDSQFKCTDITFATEPLYEEGDEIEEGDELSNEIDKNEEYSEIEKDGITYTIEAVGGEGENGFNKWKVTNVTIADQVYEIGDVIDVSELDESVTYFDNNGNTLTQDDFNRL